MVIIFDSYHKKAFQNYHKSAYIREDPRLKPYLRACDLQPDLI